MELEKFLNKKYKLDRTENFDAILIELGKINCCDVAKERRNFTNFL
jgi:hypothetical protein